MLNGTNSIFRKYPFLDKAHGVEYLIAQPTTETFGGPALAYDTNANDGAGMFLLVTADGDGVRAFHPLRSKDADVARFEAAKMLDRMTSEEKNSVTKLIDSAQKALCDVMVFLTENGGIGLTDHLKRQLFLISQSLDGIDANVQALENEKNPDYMGLHWQHMKTFATDLIQGMRKSGDALWIRDTDQNNEAHKLWVGALIRIREIAREMEAMTGSGSEAVLYGVSDAISSVMDVALSEHARVIYGKPVSVSPDNFVRVRLMDPAEYAMADGVPPVAKEAVMLIQRMRGELAEMEERIQNLVSERDELIYGRDCPVLLPNSSKQDEKQEGDTSCHP